jgi:hypothetical protein
MTLLEVHANLVRPGWAPLLVVLLIGVAMVFLFFSMRRQVRKINIPGSTTETDEHPAPRPPA